VSAPPSGAPRSGRWAWALVLAALVLVVGVRVRLLDAPLERDEGEYAYAGQLILQGLPPYRLAYNMKLPGTYVAYAAALAAFGETARGVHVGLLAVNALTILVVFLLGRRVFGDWVGAVAAACYALLSLGQGVYGVFAHATHFVALPAMAATLVLARALSPGAPGTGVPRQAALLASGLLYGVAVVMKQHGALFALFGLAWLTWELAARGVRWGQIGAACAWLAAGSALPFAVTCGWLAWAGVFPDFWQWTVEYSGAYVSAVPLARGLQVLRESARVVVAPGWPLWALAGAGLVLGLRDREAPARSRFLVALTACSFLSVCPGLYFRPHYFVLLLPAAALLAALGARAVGRGLARLLPAGPARERAAPALAGALAAIALLGSIASERAYLFSLSPPAVSRRLYGPNPFPEAIEIGRRIAADTTPRDRIAVLGSEPEIYFYARRLSATGHIYMYGLMGAHRHARAMQQQAIAEIEASAPRYLVFVNVTSSWLRGPDSDPALFAWARAYIDAHYEIVGAVDIVSPDSTVAVWGAEAAGYAPRSAYVVHVLRRRSSPRVARSPLPAVRPRPRRRWRGTPPGG